MPWNYPLDNISSMSLKAIQDYASEILDTSSPGRHWTHLDD